MSNVGLLLFAIEGPCAEAEVSVCRSQVGNRFRHNAIFSILFQFSQFMKRLFFLPLLAALNGCAWVTPAPMQEISKLPVVRVGEKPLQTDYVVFFPAGTSFPVKLKASGSMFMDGSPLESSVKLAKDLYLYKYWASHDGKDWKPSHALMSVEFGGGFDLSGLSVDIKVEEK